PTAEPVIDLGVEAAHIDDLAARTDWIRGRLAAIAAISDPKGKDAVRKFWPADTPVRPPWTDAQIDAIDALLAQVETLDEVPYPPSDPTKPTPGEVTAERQAAPLAPAGPAAQPSPAW